MPNRLASLIAPDRNDTRSTLADWLELTSLIDERRIATRSSLLSILDILDDETERISTDSETGEQSDQSILEDGRASFANFAFEEIEYRAQILGESYPFEIDDRGVTVRCRFADSISQTGQLVYVFCLLATAIRERRFSVAGKENERNAHERQIADAFQVCACLAAGGYLTGSVASFGFPRSTGDAFLPALKQVLVRFGSGQAIPKILPGYPTDLKDGGIDVIAWRDHLDKMPGKLYLVGQCASGRNWQAKSVVSYMESLHGNWINHPPKWCTPAMFIPFPVQHDLDDSKEAPFNEVIRNHYQFLERSFGIVFDRFRVAHYAKQALALDANQIKEIDGADRLDHVRHWIDAALGAGATVGVAA